MKEKKLHAAMLVNSLARGGTERVMVNLSEYLVRNDFDVTVVTQYQKENEYPMNPGIKRVISDITKDECSKSRIINFGRRFFKLRNIWKQEKPDVILSFIGKNNMMAVLTSLFLNIPVAVAVRGEPAMEYYNGWMRFLARQLFKLADGVILQTKQCYDFFPKAVRKKAVILKNPVHASFYKERFEGERDRELVAVARMDPSKNQKMLIRAFAGIAEDYPEYRLIIYGKGELKEELEALVEDLGMQGRILLPGAVSNVADAIYKARVFIMPSNSEGVPNALIEAMILGLTVIATDCPCGGPADLIEHGVNGLLTPVGDVEAMKENMRFVLNDLTNADVMGRNASKTSDIYLPERVYREWGDYLRLLALRRK